MSRSASQIEDKSPRTPVPAATLILVREGGDGLQVYLLRRSQTSGFMAGNYVFPGGLIDPLDRNAELWGPHVDLTPQELAERMGSGLGPDEVFAYAIAAIRETFEEAGALFAGRRTPLDGDLERICAMRRGKRLDSGWFKDLIASGDWLIRLTALAPWAHWITPLLMPKRFDTRFFTAVLPESQECRPDDHETTEGIWLSPREALVRNLAGTVPLSPPTVVTLQGMLGYPDCRSLLQAAFGRGWGEPVFPRLVPLGKPHGSMIIEPWDPMYRLEPFDVDPVRLAKGLLPAGEPFSRMWNRDGIWRPVSQNPI